MWGGGGGDRCDFKSLQVFPALELPKQNTCVYLTTVTLNGVQGGCTKKIYLYTCQFAKDFASLNYKHDICSPPRVAERMPTYTER